MPPPPPPLPPPPPPFPTSSLAVEDEFEFEVRYVDPTAASGRTAGNGTASRIPRTWSLRSAQRPSPTSVIVLSDLDHDGGRFDDKHDNRCTSGDGDDGDDLAKDDGSGNGSGNENNDNYCRSGSNNSKRACSTATAKKHRWWMLSVVVLVLSIAGLAGVLGYALSGGAAAGSDDGSDDGTEGYMYGVGSSGSSGPSGEDDFPGAQLELDDFPGASSASTASSSAAGTSSQTTTTTTTTTTGTTTTVAPPTTSNPTAGPTISPPTLAPTSPLRPRLVAALAALLPPSVSAGTATGAATGTATGAATANLFDPATSRGRAVDWLLDYLLSQSDQEWMLDLQLQRQQPTTTTTTGNTAATAAGDEEEEGVSYHLPPLPMELRQRYAMGVLYFEGGPRLNLGGEEGNRDGTDGENGTRSAAAPDHNYCTWRGITCTTTATTTTTLSTTASNLVTEIDWEGVNYHGTLPPEIGSLLSPTLRRLGMGTNRLTGTLPTELGLLAQLQYLNLAGNGLRGTIPPQLFGANNGSNNGNNNNKLRSLHTLQLHSNRLTGTIPPFGLGSMTSLKFMELSANRLGGPLPTTLGSMPALEWFCASSNQLRGPIPSTIGNLDRLEWFDLTDNALSGTLPPQMEECPLKWLEVGRNRLAGPIPTWLGSMETLQTLQVDDNLLTGEVPAELTGLNGLSRLKVTGNPGILPWTTLPCCFAGLEVSDLDVARAVGDGNPTSDVDGRLPVWQAGIPSSGGSVGGGGNDAPTTYRPGHLTKVKNGILLSEGLDVEIVAYSDQPVRLAGGTETAEVFHSRPDAGHAFASPSGDGSWVYVSNSEAISDGGVGAMYFDAQHRVTGYRRILSGTERNCGGGATPWGTWISCEEPWRRYNFRKGQVFEVDPWGDEGNGRRTVLGEGGGQYESFAYDVRDRFNPSFFYTEDHEEGPVRRFRPSADQIHWEDPTDMLHGDGTIDYLVLLDNGSFYWSTNKSDGANTASRYFPNTEGIDCKDGHVYFVTKRNKMMYHLDLDAETWTRSTTQRGKFDGEPDQIARILGDSNEILYMTEEEDGSMPGIHARDRNGNSFTVLESPLYVEESTGVAFSPDGKSLLVAYQKNGILLRAWREDGKSFSGSVIDIKYHTYG